MYGTATDVIDIHDMIKQQAAGTQKPVCIGESTAYGEYLENALPDLQVYETPNNNAGFLQALRDGHCDANINAYPYATDFIAERFEKGECEVNGSPVGIIGSSLGFGLSQFAVGISNDQPVEVTEAISYWLNVLMTCAPGDEDGACPTGSGLSLFEQYNAYGRGDPSKCGYVQFPAETVYEYEQIQYSGKGGSAGASGANVSENSSSYRAHVSNILLLVLSVGTFFFCLVEWDAALMSAGLQVIH